MKRTIRSLAIPAIASLLLAACGPSEPEDGGAAGEATAAEEESEQSGGDQSGSWPLVEDQDGNIVENPEDEDPEWGSSDDGDYTFSLTDEPFFAPTSDGAFITMTMDAQTEDDDEIAWLEQYRGDVGGEPVTYVLSDVDNRDGSELVNMYNISMYDQQGTEYTCDTPGNYVDKNWEPVWLYTSSDTDEYVTADGEPMDYDKGEDLNRQANEHEFSAGVSPFERATLVSICPDDLPERVTAVEVMPGGIVSDPVYATPESYMGEDG